MSSAEPILIQRLLDEVESLEAELKGSVSMEAAKVHEKRIREIRTAVMDGSVFDPGNLSNLSVDKQKELLDRLTRLHNERFAQKSVRNEFLNYSLEGDGESKQSIIWLAIFGFIFAATLLSLIR